MSTNIKVRVSNFVPKDRVIFASDSVIKSLVQAGVSMGLTAWEASNAMTVFAQALCRTGVVSVSSITVGKTITIKGVRLV